MVVPVTKVMHGSELFGQPPNPESIKAWNGLLPRKYLASMRLNAMRKKIQMAESR